MAKCKCGGTLWESNQEVTTFMACPECKTIYKLIKVEPQGYKIGTTIKLNGIKVGD